MLWTSQVFTFWKHPWTPKARAGLVSLHDLFVHAEDIADLDVSAPERIALTRLLVGITHAALGAPDSPEQWAEFSCDIAHAIPAYLTRPEVLPHFNLLGAGPRFLQKQPPAGWVVETYPLSKICFPLSSGNNPKLLDHWGDDPRPWTPAQAALALLLLQNFFVGGSMASKIKGNGPALRSLQLLLLGPSLRVTILANCLDQETLEKTGHPLGSPLWETGASDTFVGRLIPSPCAVWLEDDLQRLSLDQGHQYLDSDAYRDAFATIQVIPKDASRRVLRAKPDQAIWRDLHLLTNIVSPQESDCALNLAALRDRPDLDAEELQLWAGELIKAKDAKILDSTESTFTIAPRLLSAEGHLIYGAGVGYAEAISRKLFGAVKQFGNLLKHEKSPTEEALKHYWHALDQNQRELLRLACDPRQRVDSLPFGAERADDPWTQAVRRAAFSAYRGVCGSSTPRLLEAHTAGLSVLIRALFPKEKPPKAPPGGSAPRSPSTAAQPSLL